jgi:hypothetical protein
MDNNKEETRKQCIDQFKVMEVYLRTLNTMLKQKLQEYDTQIEASQKKTSDVKSKA